jgi:hypothetical protein
MVSSCSRAVLWSTCLTVGFGNSASILESVSHPNSAEVLGTEPVPCEMEPVPCEMEPIPCEMEPVPCEVEPVPCEMEPVPCEMEPVPCGVERWERWSLSLGFVIPKEFPNPILTGIGEVL